MEKNNDLTKILAIAGTVLVWFPILAPLIIGITVFLVDHIYRFDFLMPAELFPLALAGSSLILWASVRVQARIRLVAGGLGLAILMLFGGQGLAVATGLASGQTKATGPAWVLVLASLGIYALGILLVGLGGALLLRDLFRRDVSIL